MVAAKEGTGEATEQERAEVDYRVGDKAIDARSRKKAGFGHQQEVDEQSKENEPIGLVSLLQPVPSKGVAGCSLTSFCTAGSRLWTLIGSTWKLALRLGWS